MGHNHHDSHVSQLVCQHVHAVHAVHIVHAVHAVHAVLAVYGVHAVFTLATADRRKECCMAWHGDASCQQASFRLSHQACRSFAHTHGLTGAEKCRNIKIMT